ncbi:sensor histidine kinase [Desulfothermus sp.]
MNKILLLFKHKENEIHISNFLKTDFELLYEPYSTELSIDLIVTDSLALKSYMDWIVAKKNSEMPVFLPCLFISSRKDIKLASKFLWKVIDEICFAPIEKLELRARIEILLRSRKLSLELNKRNIDLQSILYMLIHDLKAPARAIVGFSSHIIRDPKQVANFSSDTLDLLNRIVASGKRIEDLIETEFNYLKLVNTVPRSLPVNLYDMFEKVKQELEEEIEKSGAKIDIDLEKKLLVSDEYLLRVIFNNLFSNSIKYRNKTRELIINVKGSSVKNRVFRFEIKDNGIGIPEEKIEEIFKPFVRLHGEEIPGYGIGLSIVERIILSLNGRIHVFSKLNEGTKIIIELPYKDG